MAVQSVAYRNNPDYNIGIITLLGPDAGIVGMDAVLWEVG